MPERPPLLPTRQRLKLGILLPMALGLLLFLGLYIVSTSWYLDQEIERNLNQKITDIDVSFQSLLEQQARIMRVQLEQLAESTELKQLMQNKDRAGLLAVSEPAFQRLLEHLSISHYYFHNPDQTVFLRVHNPERHSDLITRKTLQQAAATQQPHSGIELGPLGTFTLRTVLPWYQDETLIGYLELGEEVELLISSFFQQENSILTLTIDKKYLQRELWEVGAKMLGKDTNSWDLLPNKVIAQTSDPKLLPEIIRKLQNQQPKTASIKLVTGAKTYLGRVQPLLDFSGNRVGEFLVLQDVTLTLTEYRETVFAFIALCVIAASCFLLFTAIMLGKTEIQQKDTDKLLVNEMLKVHDSNLQLAKEIVERKAAETALNAIQGKLEERVSERTEQLWLSLEQTQQIRKQLTDIVSSVPDGLIVTDLENKILLVNQRANELFPCSLNECIGQPLRSIIHDPAMANRMESALQQQLSDLSFEVMQITSDLQNSIFLQIRTSVLTDKKGKAIGMIFLIHDISQEREIERMKSEFITTAVHELSTPLTAVLGYSEFLLENPDVSEQERREFLAIINDKADFLASLVGELLNISRIESGEALPLQKNIYNAHELFAQPIQHLQQLSAGHKFNIQLTTAEVKLLVDKEKIWQVMENLCSNAVKYSPAGGEINVSGRLNGQSYRVTICDQGIGLTKDQIVKVFEKFYRCNQSDTSIGGTGLGLTIVKHIIESHNGRIWINSELGQGSNVHFELPIHS